MRLAVIHDGEVVRRVETRTSGLGGGQGIVEYLRRAAKKIVAESPVPITAGGIGFGGPVDFARQRVIRSLHVSGWEDLPLPEILKEELGLPCFIDNDGTTGALGEHRYGAGRGTRNMVYCTISTGIGGGLIIEGRPYRGSRGWAGEIGHIPIAHENGDVCTCGSRGCFESYGSGPSIARRGEDALLRAMGEGRNAAPDGAGDLVAESVFERAYAGDETMMEVVAQTAQIVGTTFAGIVNLLDPDRIVVGGGVAGAGDQFFEMIDAVLQRRLVPSERPSIVVRGALGDNSVLLGAATLAEENLLDECGSYGRRSG